MSRLWNSRLVWLVTAAAISCVSATGRAQDVGRTAGTENEPLVILIKEGSRVPAQALFGQTKSATAIVAYRLTGGAVLGAGDGKFATATFRGGPITLPELSASTVGDEGSLRVVIDGQAVSRQIRVATVSASHLGEAQRLLSVAPLGDAGLRNAPPLLGAGNPHAALRVQTGYLVVDMAKVDRSRWSNEGVNVPLAGGVGTSTGRATTAGLCVRTPFPPGWIEWQGINPGAYLYSVLPESAPSLIWSYPPSQDADAMYNRYWGCYNAIKIPSHCTAYAVDGGCCCNIAASQFAGVCRVADFNGPEAGWPACPL